MARRSGPHTPTTAARGDREATFHCAPLPAWGALDPAAIEERPAAGGDRDGLSVLRLAEARKRFGPHGLQPRRAYEETAESEGERREKEPDPPVDEAVQLPYL